MLHPGQYIYIYIYVHDCVHVFIHAHHKLDHGRPSVFLIISSKAQRNMTHAGRYRFSFFFIGDQDFLLFWYLQPTFGVSALQSLCCSNNTRLVKK